LATTQVHKDEKANQQQPKENSRVRRRKERKEKKKKPVRIHSDFLVFDFLLNVKEKKPKSERDDSLLRCLLGCKQTGHTTTTIWAAYLDIAFRHAIAWIRASLVVVLFRVPIPAKESSFFLSISLLASRGHNNREEAAPQFCFVPLTHSRLCSSDFFLNLLFL
jgi:hypothetical protein